MKRSKINTALIAAKKTLNDHRWALSEWEAWGSADHETQFHDNKTKREDNIVRGDDLTDNYFLKPLGRFSMITKEATAHQQLWNEVF